MSPTTFVSSARAIDLRAPHRRGRRLLLVLAAALSLVLLAGCLSPSQSAVLDSLNADRDAAGLRSLPVQADAQAKAQRWAEKMAADQALSHSVLADGINVRWCSLAENVGDASSAQAVEDAYMTSSVHRANILGTRWNGVGVGSATNNGVVYTVQIFITTC